MVLPSSEIAIADGWSKKDVGIVADLEFLHKRTGCEIDLQDLVAQIWRVAPAAQ